MSFNRAPFIYSIQYTQLTTAMTGDSDVEAGAKRRELFLGRQLDLGHYGKIPISNLYQTYVDTEDGGELVFHQTKMTSLGGWVCVD